MSDTAIMLSALAAGAAITLGVGHFYNGFKQGTTGYLEPKEGYKGVRWLTHQWLLTDSVWDNQLTQTVKQAMGPRPNNGLEKACAQCKKSPTNDSSVTKNPSTDGGVLTGTVLRKEADPAPSKANTKYKQYSTAWKEHHPEWKEQATADGYM